MAFFDDIGKKLSQAGQTAVQKTKDMADIAKYNASISDEEKRINNAYNQIGKLYFTMHSNDYESDFGGMINSIKDAESKIAEYRQLIQDLKGVVRCEKCGAEVDSNVAFCSACGAPMSKQAAPSADTINCPGCGSQVKKGARFCTICGQPMAETAPVETQSKTCPTCGETVDSSTTFCAKCGCKID